MATFYLHPKAKILEKDIEKTVCEYSRNKGIAAYKFTSPARAAVPDRIHLAKVPEEHVQLIARYIRFVEYKRHGQKPTPAQEREHQRLREMGFTVEVVDTVESGKVIVNSMGA